MPSNHQQYHPYYSNSSENQQEGKSRNHQHSRHHHHQHHRNQRGNNEYQNDRGSSSYYNSESSNQYKNKPSSSSSSSSSSGRYFEQLNNQKQQQQGYRGGNNQATSKQVRFENSQSIRSVPVSNTVKQPETQADFCDVCRTFDQIGMMQCIGCRRLRHSRCDHRKTPKTKENPNVKYIQFMCEHCFEVKVKIEGDDFRVFALTKDTTIPKEVSLDKMDDHDTSSASCPLCNELIAGHSREIWNNHLRFQFKNELVERNLIVGTIPIAIISKNGQSIEHSFKPNDFSNLSTSFFVLGFKKEQLNNYMDVNCRIERDDINNFLESEPICFLSCKSVKGAFLLACKLRCAVIEKAHPMIYFIKSTRSLKVFQNINSKENFNSLNGDQQSIKNMEITSVVPSEGKKETIVHFNDEWDCIRWLWAYHKSSKNKNITRIEFHDDHVETLNVCHVGNLPSTGITLTILWKQIKGRFKELQRRKIKYFVSDWSYDSSNHIIRVEFHHPKFCELFKVLMDGWQIPERSEKLTIVIPNK